MVRELVPPSPPLFAAAAFDRPVRLVPTGYALSNDSVRDSAGSGLPDFFVDFFAIIFLGFVYNS